MVQSNHAKTEIMKNIYSQILKNKKRGKKSLVVLLDPDKIDFENISGLFDRLNKIHPDYIFIGGSLLITQNFDRLIQILKKNTDIPLVLFPGNYNQIHTDADAILFLSLISGRNPDFLIGQHVSIAPVLAKSELEIIPTGYILIENGKTTSVEYISQTKPIPRDKPGIALATALAGEMLGMKLIYLEAGSGAKKPVPKKTVRLLSQELDIPLIVGGGIKTYQQIEKYHKAGADIVVVGTAFEHGEM